MHIVIAPDKFKGSLSAPEVAAHLAAGIHALDPGIRIESVPMADGGEGTLDAALGSGFSARTVTVAGPTGRPLQARIALSAAEPADAGPGGAGPGDAGTTAVVEMATASGLDVLPGGVKDARGATSRGTGQLIAAALDAGATEIVLGVGGSASTDGGAGLLVGLGARLLDANGNNLPDGGAALTELARVDLSGLDRRLAGVRFILASDVDNPLLGPAGAAAVYGPQKGADPADVIALDAALARFVAVLSRELGPAAAAAAGAAGAGAAGGVGYVALAALAAKRRAGIDVVLEFTDLEHRLAGADLVITGEGSLDAQSLSGKTPIGVARAAARANVPVLAVCGRTTLSALALAGAGFRETFALANLEPDIRKSMANAGALLEQIGERIGRQSAAGVANGRG